MLPCLISVPHGGTKIPREVRKLVILSPRDILEDGDPFTPELYDLDVESKLVMEIARAIVDVNRAPDDTPPNNPDGVVKSETAFGKKVYREFPDRKLIEILLNRYYFPFHRKIVKELKRENVLIAFDCHSMAPIAPKVAPDKGRRPSFCLGNYYGRACSMETTETLRECLTEVFELPHEEVEINEPFAGGYITRTYGMNPKPWIQIEINRDMYMNWEELKKDEEKLEDVRKKLQMSLKLFFERASL
ncbi:N-formylglutamate amidohydrolase [Hydrogenivirga sp. 128-5-R1-1]|uniref:N-formylglutamate amidohydrolase n=1 Tax=Hydrogenivirga sp. 128-5-R1-1 TaxID=392423 RepID=UPI00015EFCB7|nr:N-formylglutamate amidohydrolase [Hydrogenivirga sp. 128-5-R1-1]EDP74501.1 N-formylglutamate amidohydrolase, putative [Hydrogenivirga sp. 128-5-R1-1]